MEVMVMWDSIFFYPSINMYDFYFQFTDDGDVATYSEQPIITDSHNQIFLTVTPEQYEQMQQNYLMKIVDNALSLTKTAQIVKMEEEQIVEVERADLQEKIDNETVTILDLAKFLVKSPSKAMER